MRLEDAGMKGNSMSLRVRSMLIISIVFGCATAVARADDRAQIQTSIASIITALSNGDGSAAKKYVVDEKNNQKLVDSAARISKESKELQKAAVAKFGAQGKEVGDAGLFAKNPPYMPVLHDLDQSRISINGDTATVPPKHSYGRTLTFKRQGGVWKLEIQAEPDLALRHAIWAGNIADALRDVATEIKKVNSVQPSRPSRHITKKWMKRPPKMAKADCRPSPWDRKT